MHRSPRTARVPSIAPVLTATGKPVSSTGTGGLSDLKHLNSLVNGRNSSRCSSSESRESEPVSYLRKKTESLRKDKNHVTFRRNRLSSTARVRRCVSRKHTIASNRCFGGNLNGQSSQKRLLTCCCPVFLSRYHLNSLSSLSCPRDSLVMCGRSGTNSQQSIRSTERLIGNLSRYVRAQFEILGDNRCLVLLRQFFHEEKSRTTESRK